MRSISAKVTLDIAELKRRGREAGDAVRRFGRDVKDTSREASADLTAIDATAAKLAGQIESTSKAVDDLGRAFAKTGDATLLKQREQQQKLLGELRKAQSLVFDVRRSEDDGGRAGRAYARSLKDAVSSAGDIFASTAMDLGKVIPPEVKIALVAGAAAAAPIISSALAGAVSGAAGSLGIVGGFALAARDPAVKAAAGQIGQDILADLTSNAGMFGEELIGSLDRFRNEIRSLDDEFESIFANSADYTGPLTDSISNALGDVVQGIDNVVANAGPAMAALGSGIELIGGEVEDFLNTVAANGDTGAKALTDLFTMAQLAIQQVTILVDLFAKVYDFVNEPFGASWLGGFGLFGILSDLNGANNDVADSSNRAGQGADRLNGALADVADTATVVQHKFESIADAVASIADGNLDAAEAALRLREATAAAGEAADGKAKVSIDEEKALYALARASNAATDSADEQGRTAQQAAEAYARQRKQLIAAAEAMGYSRDRAKELADQLLHIPKNVNPHVNLTIQNQAKLNAVREAIAMLPGRKDVVVAINVTGNTNVQSVRAALDKQTSVRRWGGIDRPLAMAAGGTLPAGIYPASSPPLVKFAEPSTGGEAYIPRNGNRARNLSIMREVAAWPSVNAMVVPMAAGGIAAARGGYVNVSTGPAARSGTRLDTASAALDARNAVAALNAALKENGRSFSESTKKGRENRSVLIQGIRAAQDAAQAKYDETGSVAAANKEYDRYIRALQNVLGQQKASAATLRQLSQRPAYDTGTAAPRNSSNNIAYVRSRMDLASAKDAARGFFDASWGKPTFRTDTPEGRDNLNALFDYLGAAEGAAQARFQQTGNARSATRLYDSSLTSLRSILRSSGMSDKEIDGLFASYGRISLGNRWGGVYEHMAAGGLRTAHIAPAGPTRYAYAEPSTGGELFAPKNGDLAKTRAEVSWAVANWWGGQVAWGPGPGATGGAAAGAMTIRVVVQDGSVQNLVRVEVDEALGSLANAAIYQTTA